MYDFGIPETAEQHTPPEQSMTTPIAENQLLQLQMIEQWFDTNAELMRNEIIQSQLKRTFFPKPKNKADEMPSVNVSYPFMAYLFDQALITNTPDDRMIFMGCELTPVDNAAFVWEIA